MGISSTPLLVSMRSMAAMLICSADGDAKMVPATAPARIPLPTYPAKAGSWPEPPPLITATLSRELASGLRKMILCSRSKARDGLVRVSEFRAVKTRWSGSEMKCLAGERSVSSVFFFYLLKLLTYSAWFRFLCLF